MPAYSNASQTRLEECSRFLKDLFRTVVIKYDCSILTGHRGEVEQNEKFAQKLSKVRWPDGKHNKIPSEAADVGPYIPGRNIPWPKTPDDWNDNTQRNNYIKDMMQFAHFAGYVQGTANSMGREIRWGGDWDRDHDLRDNKFDDLVHFEEVVGDRT